MSYVDDVLAKVIAKNPSEPEFHQAVKEVLDSLKVVIDKNEVEYRKLSILERLVEPERIISFKVPWIRFTTANRSSKAPPPAIFCFSFSFSGLSLPSRISGI